MNTEIHDVLHPLPNAIRDEVRRGLISGQFDATALGELEGLATKTANDPKANIGDVMRNEIARRIGLKVMAGQLTIAG